MKKIVLFCVALCVTAAGVHAASPESDAADREPRRNVITGSLEFFPMDLFQLWGGPAVSFEYAYNVRGKFWAGGRMNAQYSTFWGDSFNGDVLQNYWRNTLYGLGYWDFPVAKDWLSFRLGAGVGIGFHSGKQISGVMVAPCWMGRAEWVVRLTRNFGSTGAPLVLGPSGVEWSPWAPHTATGGRGNLVQATVLGRIGFFGRF